MKRLVILNPQSRHGRAGRIFDRQQGEWEKHLGRFDVYRTRAPGDAAEKVKSALRNEDVDQILIAGGDGSVNEAFRGYWDGHSVIRSDIPLGIINLGTGGDLVRTLEASCEDYVEALVQNRFRMVDAPRIVCPDGTEYPFLNVASFGMAAEVLRRLKRSRFQTGAAAYFCHTLRTLLEFEAIGVTVEFVGDEGGTQSIEREILNGFVCNGRFSGGGMQWAPGAELDSGLFRVTLIEGGHKATLIRHSGRLYSGRIGSVPGAESFEAREVIVKCATSPDLETDGEILDHEIHPGGTIRFELMAKAFPLVY